MLDNKSTTKVPRGLKNGRVYLDGELVMDLVTAEINFSPIVAEKRTVGEAGVTRRWMGYDITGAITSYRSTPFYKNAVKKYLETGETPYFTIVGNQDDPAADYDKAYGNDVVTVEEAVITSDINLIKLDSEGEYVEDEIEFGGRNVIIA